MQAMNKTFEELMLSTSIIIFESEIQKFPNDFELGKYIREKFEKSKKKS